MPTDSDQPFRVLSLGAGTQSSALYLMAQAGECEAPDVAIFADTQREPPAVYRWISEVLEPARRRFPLVRVTAGDLGENIRSGDHFSTVPFHVRNREGEAGMLRRQCTRDFKIRPIIRKVRELIGAARKGPVSRAVEMWLGITTDEPERIKPSRRAYISRRYPLVEMDLTRADCVRWCEEHGYGTPPRSSCTFCPFHSNDHWRTMKRDQPEAWAEAVEFDRFLRSDGALPLVDSDPYLHPSLQPLEEVEFGGEGSSFLAECEGHCGL